MTKAYPAPLIELRNVAKTYREAGRSHEIFGGLNLTVAAGEFVVLLGRSGSGKSTLLNLIAGIEAPSGGNIRVGGVDLTALTEHGRTLFRRHRIGYVFQSYNLIPTLTVEENLLLPLELIKRLDSEGRRKVNRLIARLGLSGRHDAYPDRLSGGEQQRVAIARSLIHDPDLILADEPTGNLDLETGEQVIDLLDELVRKAGKTLVMATHSREVIGIADRVLSIRNRDIHSADDSLADDSGAAAYE
ncbi:MAG: ABC transporter ATP-binding protein [Gammaproteobacteria bacterium]